MSSSLPMYSPLLFPVAMLTVAYLIGSIPFAVVSSRLFGLADPRSYGSGNPGATNVLRSGNKTAALCTLLGDAGKGYLAVFLAQLLSARFGFGAGVIALVAVAAFLGHVFSIFLGFKGGKGVATAAGVLLALDPALGLVALGTWLGVAIVFRYSSLAALVAALVTALGAFMIWGANPQAVSVGVIAMILVGKHWPNLQRLMAGAEPKIGGKKKEKKA